MKNFINIYRRPLTYCLPVAPGELPLLESRLPSVAAQAVIPARIRLYPLVGLGVEERQGLESLRALSGLEEIEIEAVPSRSPLQALVRAAITRAGEGEILFVRPGVQLPRAGEARLRWALSRQPRLGTLSPLSTQGRTFVVPSQLLADQVSSLSLEGYNHILLGGSDFCLYSTPTPNPSCFLLSAGAAAALDPSDWLEAEDPAKEWLRFSRTLRDQGWDSVVCDHVAVAAAAARSDHLLVGIEASEEGRAFLELHPLTPLAKTVETRLMGGEDWVSESQPQPGVLHVMHNWGGGLEQWVRSYCGAEGRVRHLVLKSVGNWGAFGQRLWLHQGGPDGPLLEEHNLGRPIRATETAHARYREILHGLLERHGVDLILVSSLIGHAFELLETDIPTYLVAHDYAPFCPALNISFGELCTACPSPHLASCFRDNPHNRFFINMDAPDWLPIRERYAAIMSERRLPWVAPSPSVINNLVRLEPRLGLAPAQVIPHGIPPLARLDEARRQGHGKLRLLLLGHLSLNKGKSLLLEALPQLTELAELVLLGCGEDGEEFFGRPGVEVIPGFQREELAERVQEIDPDLGLLLSVVPETFSFALSEFWAMGIPVLATATGSFADRIQEADNGFLCRPSATDLVAKVRALVETPELLEQVRARLRQRPVRTLEEMAQDYWRWFGLHAFSYAGYGRQLQGRDGVEGFPIPRHIEHLNLPFLVLLRQLDGLIRGRIAASPRLSAWQRPLLGRLYGGVSRLLAWGGGLLWREPKTRVDSRMRKSTSSIENP